MSESHEPQSFTGRSRFPLGAATLALIAGLLFSGPLFATDIKELQELYDKGEYQVCLQKARAELEDNNYSQSWRLIMVQCQLAVGDYDGVTKLLTESLDRFPRNIPLRWYDYLLAYKRGETNAAARDLKEIDDYAGPRLRYLQEAETLTYLGRAALRMGAEPKLVLDNFLLRARQMDRKYMEAWLAAGELALSKHDYDLAAKTFQEGLKEIPDNPDLLQGLARAYAPSDRAVMIESLKKALEKNPNHVPSLLLLADHLIDSEDYEQANAQLDKALKVNPNSPEAWAYQAVIAHIRNQPEAEKQAHAKALAYLKADPNVDHLIGLKLSLKYRFKEGAEYQREALKLDENYLPARIQLAQDLLRLGDVDQGWKLADAVHKDDAYDVTAFNLVTLHDQYARFATLTNEHFIVHMSQKDAAIIGDEVLDLLRRAHDTLTKKFGYELSNSTQVEIFDDPRDFGVRTFGMPGNPGYLGVCFGDVITANSPSSPMGSSTAWASVLWHEFCHVITLNMTKNKMPRWLSEGISVHEELAADPSWGQRMTPEYIELILGGKMHPVSDLSAAFLTADSNLDLQFAYYQSALVVEFIVKQYGFNKLLGILHDLGEGTEINEAIANHTEPIKTIDGKFAAYAKKQAHELGDGLEWKKPKLAGRPAANPGKYSRTSIPAGTAKDLLSSQPNNYWAFIAGLQELISQKNWEEAKPLLERLFKRVDHGFETPQPYILAAAIWRGLDQPDKELEVLNRAAAIDGSQLDVFQRLTELETARTNWSAAANWSRRAIGMNPFLGGSYRSLADADEELGNNKEAVAAVETMLKLDPLNPAELHFRAARLEKDDAPAKAKRHLLLALEDAPRFRDAHRLLLQLEENPTETKPEPPAPVEAASPKPEAHSP